MTASNDGLWAARLIKFHSLPSTNTWALQNADECRHGDIILAEHQTAGRGRFQREWISPKGSSLTISFILSEERFSRVGKENYQQITAVAVRKLLDDLSINAKLKWPNDIMTDNGKICGILAESISDKKVVVGIGLNIRMEHCSPAIPTRYTSIHAELSSEPEFASLLTVLKKHLESEFDLCDKIGMESIWQEWHKHDFLCNENITLKTATRDIAGIYRGVNAEGQILVETEGKTVPYSSGDVSLSR